jgi:hypothetical protein
MAVNGISEIFRFLGRPERRSMLRSDGGALLNRTAWACGCVAHQIEAQDVTTQWDMCPAHMLAGGPRNADAASSPSC